MTTYVTDPFAILQTAGETYVGADAGEDTTYMISATMIQAGDIITVVDTQGANTIQLVDGLGIESSTVVANELVLNLTNGAVVNVRGAATFSFDVGGNDVMGVDGVVKSFADFASQDLGVTLPGEGEDPVTGGEVIIGQGGVATVDLNADEDGVVEGTEDAEIFALLVDTGNFSIENFDVAADSLSLDLPVDSDAATLADLNGLDLGDGNVLAVQANEITGDTFVSFGLDDAGNLISLTLVGVSDVSAVQVDVI